MQVHFAGKKAGAHTLPFACEFPLRERASRQRLQQPLPYGVHRVDRLTLHFVTFSAPTFSGFVVYGGLWLHRERRCFVLY